jgi:hypothetical protein
LLQSRKKSVPSNGWLQQLPHKARKLEGRLYLTATSLEQYLDRSTLKVRLKTLANVIMVQFNNSRKVRLPHSLKLRANAPVSATVVSARTAASTKAGESQRTVSGDINGMNIMQSQHHDVTMRSGSTSSFTNNPGSSEVRPSNGTTNLHISGADTRRQSVNSECSTENASFRQANEMSLGQPMSSHGSGPQQQQLLLQQQALSSFSNETRAMLPTASSETEVGGTDDVGNPGISGLHPMAMASAQNVSELERQKAVNARLQVQIMENIRRQEDLVRRLQAQEFPSQSAAQQSHHLQPLNNNYHSNNDMGVSHSSALNMLQRQGIHGMNHDNSNFQNNELASLANANVANMLRHVNAGGQPFPNDLGAFLMASGGAQLPPNVLQTVLQSNHMQNQFQNNGNPGSFSNSLIGFQTLPPTQYGDLQHRQYGNASMGVGGVGGVGARGAVNPLMGQTNVGLPQALRTEQFRGYEMNATDAESAGNSDGWNADEQRQVSLGINPAHNSAAPPKQGL